VLSELGDQINLYTIEDFEAYDLDAMVEIELNLKDLPPELKDLEIISSAFRYTRDWRSSIHCISKSFLSTLEDLNGSVSLGSCFPSQEFLCVAQKYSSEESSSFKFSPKSKPFLYGKPFLASNARCIVINGPSSFVQGRRLGWETENASFEYTLFPEMRKILNDKEKTSGLCIPTGVLSVNFRDPSLVDHSLIWKTLYRASRVLTFVSGIGAGVGHIELTNGTTDRFWLLGFSKFDRFPRQSNWFDIEMIDDFRKFAKAYHAFLDEEPPALPLTYSSDFYRASNSSRESSITLSLIASYSALEILVHHILRDHAKWNADLLARGKFSDRMRACAAFIRLEADPLEHANSLKGLSKRFNNEDGFTILSEVRNSIVHSDKTLKVNGLHMVELWVMCQWLVEVFTFYLIGYKGKMADRRRLRGVAR